MKIFRHIAPILVTGLFFISSSGVFITIHYCSAEDNAGLFLFTILEEDPCDHHSGEPDPSDNGDGETGTGDRQEGATRDTHCCDDHEQNQDLCRLTHEMSGCCSNTILYVAVEDVFVKSDQPDLNITISEALPGTGQDLIFRDLSCGINLADFNTEPPWPLHGKELAILNSALLL